MAASVKELALTMGQVLEVLELRLPEYEFYRKVSGHGYRKGSKVGNLTKLGYVRISVNGSLFMAHRLVWFVVHGKFPDGDIDHINGNRSDNRIENLRDVTRRANLQNVIKRPRNDPTLPTGINVVHNKFREIQGYYAHWQDMDGKMQQVYFGLRRCCTLEAALDAAIARRELEIANLNKLGASYTERHGVE